MTLPSKTLGIMQLDTRFPRVPGDIGNAKSYEFPVNIKVISGATVNRVVVQGDVELFHPFLQAAKELEAEGVFAITTSCGFLAPFQEEIAAAVKVPVFLSSLVQIPLAYMITQGRIGVISANGATLTTRHFRGAGVGDEFPLAIQGLDDKRAFSAAILEDGETINIEQIRCEVVEATQELLAAYPDVRAFVFECHNLAPYAAAVVEATGLPVFDIISLAHYVYDTVSKQDFPQ